MILYEYPFNERIRTYLRLEQLFLRLTEFISRDSALDHHFAIATIFEIMDVGARADLKSDALKDLDKQKHLLDSYRNNPAIAPEVLDKVFNQVDRCFTALNNLVGKAGQSLTENDWLMSIRSRIGIPGGTCAFDLPAYHAWQQGSALQRRSDLERWSSTLTPLTEAIYVLLKLLRGSSAAQKVVAVAGQYQQNLPQGKTFQLLRMALDPALGLVPEISGNRLMVSIRMMRHGDDDKMHATTQDTSFELNLCS